MVAAGAVLHAALFTGMWAKGLWEIKKVEAADDPLALTVGAPIPSVSEQRPKSTAPPPPRPTPVVVRVTTQPTLVTTRPVEPDPGGGGDPEPTTGGTDDPDAVGGGGSEVTAVAPPVTLPVQPIKPPPPPRETSVRSDVLEQRRIAGDKRILPDDETAQQMSRAAQTEARGVVKLCLGSDGHVRSASMIKSTGFAAYDAKLGREMRGWRYQPYQVDGVAAPVCTVITVIYRQR